MAMVPFFETLLTGVVGSILMVGRECNGSSVKAARA